MALLYIWFALLVILFLMLLVKLVTKIALACRGQEMDWNHYNATLIVLAGIAFLPISVLYFLVKSVK